MLSLWLVVWERRECFREKKFQQTYPYIGHCLRYFLFQLGSILSKYPKVLSILESPPISYILYALMKVYVTLFMGYSLASFVLLKNARWWKFYSSLYFVGHIFFGSWLILEPLLKMALKSLFPSPKPRNADSLENKKPNEQAKKEMWFTEIC